MQRGETGIPRRQGGSLGPFELVEDGAVAGMEGDAGRSEQGAVGGLVHQIAPDREDVLAGTQLTAAQAAVLAVPFDRLLQVLHVGRGLLVDDDEIGDEAAGAHILLEAQRLGDDLQVG